MAQDPVKAYVVLGIVFVCVSVVILLLTLLDYFQDGKAETSVLFLGVAGILLGIFFYASGKKSQAQDK